MKQKIKDEIKDALQTLALAAAGGVVVFHVNSFFKPNSSAPQTKNVVEQVAGRTDSIAHSDSVAVFDRIDTAKNAFLSGFRRELPTR